MAKGKKTSPIGGAEEVIVERAHFAMSFFFLSCYYYLR